MAQMKEQIKDPKIELSNEEIDNLSDAEFKMLVIRMLTEMVEYGHKIEGKVKAMQSKIKIYREPKAKGRKLGLNSTNLEQKEERNIQPEQNKETRIPKNEEMLRNLQDSFKHSNIQIIGVPEEEEEEQKIENLFDK